MKIQNSINLSQLFYLIILFVASTQHSIETEKEHKYFFIMYPSQNDQTPLILYAFTPFSQFLTINSSNTNEINIKKEATNENIYKNLSSILLYEKEYLIKSIFSPNILMEIISQNETKKKETANIKNIITSKVNFDVENNIVFSYTSIILNPNKNYSDKKAIITFLCEKNENKTNSRIEYSYKVFLFYPDSQEFSNIYFLHSEKPSYFTRVLPMYCITLRETDIFCTIKDETNQFVIETINIFEDDENNTSIYVITSELNIGDKKNLRPISLNNDYMSSTGGLYDKFVMEYHNKEKNETLLYHCLYRKSQHHSLVTAFNEDVMDFGVFIKENYIGYNLFNVLIPYPNEAVIIYIFNNAIKLTRVDYSTSSSNIQRSAENIGTGSYSTKIPEECKYPKYLQATYIKNYIKYDTSDQDIVNKNIEHHYTHEKDIQIVLSCSNSENDDNSEVVYSTKIISLPQCLIDLDSIHGFGIHKINFYLDIETIIYDVYADPRLKSFRNVGLIFYPIEAYFAPLLFLQIKTSSDKEFYVPKANTVYLNVTHLRFERVNPRYVPHLRRRFYLYYRLIELNYNNKDKDTSDRMSSNLCSFQIKFYPFNSPYGQSNDNSSDYVIQENDVIENTEQCNVDSCAVCTDNNIDSCQTCDTSEISNLIIDNEFDSKSYNICICDPKLGFLKEPNLEYNLCMCQEDYYYYKSIELCRHKDELENGPYYKKTEDDFIHTPVYDDCYYTCKKCSKAKNETSHNCLECQDGYAYIDDDISNCYDIKDLDKGYHQVDKDHFIKCHDNCVSCSNKSTEEEQFCTECKSHVPYMLKKNLLDEHFNCIEYKCDLNQPELLFAYSKDSYQCIKDCKDGVQPYNLSNICWETCGNDYIFLDEETKKCYSICNENKEKIYSNIVSSTCSSECSGAVSSNNICLECEGDKTKYKNKEGVCVKIPEECLIVDINNGLCKKCVEGYYPLKEEMNEESFNCYGTIEDIIKKENKTNYYFNDTGKYWEECYESCETCDSYGSENRQRCNSCKPGYHFASYFENNFNNCNLNLSSYENCTSSQEDIYKYKDFCHMCIEGYSFAYNNTKCLKDEDLKNGSFYEDKIEIIKDYDKNETIEKTIYYPCHKNCKTCKGKGDYYNNNCSECKEGYKFDINNKNKTCLKINSDNTDINDIKTDYDSDSDIETSDINYENIKTEDIWFKLGKEIFYIYRERNCFFLYYEGKILLISNKEECSSICPDWTNSIEDSTCVFKNYLTFSNMTRDIFNSLAKEAYEYDEIKADVSIIMNKPEKKMCFHITNFVSESPNNLSTIHIEEYETDIKNYYNISLSESILSMKVDIKKENFNTTQVEYQFYHPKTLETLNIKNALLSKRRLDGESGNEGENIKLKIDSPVDLNEDLTQNIDELSSKHIDAFNSSIEFYTDNCNQYTTSKNKDIYLEDRKKNYYPDIELCEENCKFSKYNPDTKKITCECNCKTSTDNYESIKFVKNDVDKKFSKKHFFENLQSMKCISKIFKPENLKKNPGFIIMIFFLAIFIVSFILYYIFGSFIKIRTDIYQLGRQNLFDNESDKNKIKEGNNNDANKQDNNNNVNINPNIEYHNGNDDNKNENRDQLIDNEPKNRDNYRNFSESSDIRNQIDYSREDDSHYGKGHVEKEDLMTIKTRNNNNSNLIPDNAYNTMSTNLNRRKLEPIKKKEIKKQNLFDGSSESSKDKSYNINPNETDDNKNEKNQSDNAKKNSNSSEEKLIKEEEKTKNTNKNILIDNDEDNDSLHFNNINNNINGFNKKENNPQKKDKHKLNNDSETSSNYDMRRRNDNIDQYGRDFDIQIEESEDKEYDIISDFDKGSKANPPKRKRDLDTEKRNIFMSNHEEMIDSGSKRTLKKKEKMDIKIFDDNKACCCVSIIKGCSSLCGKGNDFDNEESFKNIYMEDLKKHHIIYYTFFNLKDSLFLKLSFFAFSIHLYFGLNTILTFNLSMAESYFDKTRAKPGFIAMNLLLPYVICGLISLIIKIIIMPQYYLARLENDLNELKERMKINEGHKEEERPKVEEPQKTHRRTLKNKKEEKSSDPFVHNIKNYESEKKRLQSSSYESYLKTIIIYFIICLIIMLFNSYMMTSFCSIYRNTGVKLLVNSIVSLIVALIIPFILGLIPTSIGFLAKKTGNNLLEKIYQIINFII